MKAWPVSLNSAVSSSLVLTHTCFYLSSGIKLSSAVLLIETTGVRIEKMQGFYGRSYIFYVVSIRQC